MNGPANTPAGPPRVDREHPYLGLEYFREEDSVYFFGRAREIAEIFRFVQRGVLTVLFGKSGLGKSSLINAGLCPLLREKNFLPVPIRVSCGKDAEDLLAQIKRNLAGAISACCVETPPPGDDQSLWEYLHRTPFWSEKLRPLMPVIILDQFEEVFIHGSEDSSLKSFLEVLADVIENRIPERLRDRLDETGETLPFNYEIPKAKVIISLRKDYLSDLEDLKHSMPSVMRNRYHLKQMSESQALDAVLEPAKHLLTRDVAIEIVRFVASGKASGSEVAIRHGEAVVEPAILSLFCRELNNRRIEQGVPGITMELMRESKSGIIEEFYRRGIGDMGLGVRTLLEDKLLTASGYRSTKALDDVIGPEVSQSAINTLVNRRLLRVEDRLGIPHVEIIHDILTPVISESRRERHAEKAREQERIEREEVVRHERIKRGEAVRKILLVAAAALIMLFFIIDNQHKRTDQREILARMLALNAQNIMNGTIDNLELAVLLAIESLKIAEFSPEAADILSREISLFLSERVSLSHEDSVNAVAITTDSRQVVSGSDDMTVRIWDAATGRPLGTLKGHEGGVYGVAFSPDGKQIVSASDDMTVRIWDAVTGRTVRILRGHEGSVYSVAFSTDGKRIVSASKDMTVRIWDAVTGRTVRILRGHQGSVYSVAFSPDGKRTVSGGDDMAVRIWDTSTGRQIQALTGHEDAVNSVTFSHDGKRIVSGSEDMTIRIWDAATGRIVGMPLTGHMDAVNSVTFSHDGKLIVSASKDRTGRIWDVLSGKEQKILIHDAAANSVAISPDGKVLATAGADKKTHMWDTTVSRELELVQLPEGVLFTKIAFSSDGQRLAAASVDGVIQIWDVDRREEMKSRIHVDAFNSLAFSPNGKNLATAGYDKTIRLWDLDTGKEMKSLVHVDIVNSLALSPDEKKLATAGYDKTVRLWDLDTGKELKNLVHVDVVNSLTFSPDGKLLATASYDKTVRLWDLDTGKELKNLVHVDVVNSLAFGPDGKLLATAGVDRAVRIWGVSSGKEQARLSLMTKSEATAFSRDGGKVLTAGLDGTVRISPWQKADMINESCSRRKRNLSGQEWRQYIGDKVPCGLTCKDLPNNCGS